MLLRDKVYFIIIPILLLCYYLFGIAAFWTYSCILFSIGLFFLIRGTGQRLIFKDIILLMGITQMMLAPSYFLIMPENRIDIITQAHILPEEYFQYAFPATCLLVLGLVFPIEKLDYEKLNTITLQKLHGNIRIRKEGYALFVIGLFAALSHPIMPSIIQHVFYILKSFMYIGILYLLFSGLITVPLIFVLFTSLQGLASGMVGSFIWPIGIFGIYFLVKIKYKSPLIVKIGLLTLGFFTLVLLQKAKGTFRDMTWFTANYEYSSTTDRILLFGELLVEEFRSSEQLFELHETAIPMFIRLDQGYLVNYTLEHVPAFEPYAGGETIFLGIASAFIPRLFWPDKPLSGGRAKMERFANRTLGRAVSMNIGHFGEAYVNFGKTGGAFFMFVWGLFINLIFWSLAKIGTRKPYFLLWIPAFFVGGINTFGTDFVSSLNTLAKSFLLIYFVLWILRRIKL